MGSFISEITAQLLHHHDQFENVTLILPSERAKIFVKKEFKQEIEVGFLPEVISISEFVGKVSRLEKIDTISLLFHFYFIYQKAEKAPESFDRFTGWATTVLQDFNEIDQHLINAKDIFAYIRDIQRLRKWSVKGTFQETDLIKDHNAFLERLNLYYENLKDYLLDKNLGYQGLIYRKACESIDDFLASHNNKFFYFIGFNALNKAEEYIIKKMLMNANTDIIWDIDKTFLNSNHQGGKFIRRYRDEWRYLEKKELGIVGNHFQKEKRINIIGASKNITQIKYAAEQLSKIRDISNTAFVLSDETLLPICLNSLPSNVHSANITMGYPLKDLPITHLFYTIFQLFISQVKLNRDQGHEFYHRDILSFTNQAMVQKIIPDIELLKDRIAKENLTFVSYELLQSFFEEHCDSKSLNVLSDLLAPYATVANFIDRIIAFIELLKEEVSPLEKEYLFRYYRMFNQLKDLEEKFRYFPDINTLFLFLKRLVQSETISFLGEPLKGLQIMGMLETRVLDFENVILISANEGILPGNHQQHSFIPFDVKLHFQLPTYREKDAIFSYHFFRLLQRAKNITIIYNTETDAFGKGEKSRFVTQLEKLRTDITYKMVAPRLHAEPKDLQTINKSESVFKELKEMALKGISPSTITNYLNNPIGFYKQKVLKIRELDDVEETVAFNTLGNVVHHTLEELYKPFDGKYVKVAHVKAMLEKVDDLVLHYFEEAHFTRSQLATGKNRLIFEVAKQYVSNFLRKEMAVLSEPGTQLKMISREQRLSVDLQIENLDFPIKIHGIVDRIDELNGQLRIIDYKTGKVEPKNLKIPNLDELRTYDKHKAIQVMIYAYLFAKSTNYDFSKPIHAGIFSMKNLQAGFMKINFAHRKPDDFEITQDRLDSFMRMLKEYIAEIFDLSLPFQEAENLKY